MDSPESAYALSAGPGSGSGAGASAGAPASPSVAGAGQAVPAAVVQPGGRGAPYRMYEALAVTVEGATLRGGLLLEVSEEVTLELALPDRTALRARARVVEIVHGKPPAMKVVWSGLADADRVRLRG